jgi:hypothetical protein
MTEPTPGGGTGVTKVRMMFRREASEALFLIHCLPHGGCTKRREGRQMMDKRSVNNTAIEVSDLRSGILPTAALDVAGGNHPSAVRPSS